MNVYNFNFFLSHLLNKENWIYLCYLTISILKHMQMI